MTSHVFDADAQFGQKVPALQASAECYRTLFEGSRDALILAAAPSWKFGLANRATAELFGASSVAELAALGLWDVSPPQQPDGRLSSEKAQEMIAIALREGTHLFEWEHQRLDGQPFPAEVLLTAITLQDKPAIQASVRDITQRKQAEQEIHRLKQNLEEQVYERTQKLRELVVFNENILATSPIGIFVYRADGQCVAANDAAAKLVGGSHEKLLDQNFRELESWRASGLLDAAEYALATGDIIGLPVEFSSSFGRDVCLNCKCSIFLNHGVQHLLLTAEDVTERKKDELAIEDAMYQLEKKELAKTRFLAAAGHDLRQPLAAVSLYLDVLKYTEPTDEQNEVLQCLSQSMDTFKSLLDALLNISKLDAGVIKPEFTAISVSELIIWLEETFAPMAFERQLDLRLFFPIKETLFFRGDIGLTKSILMNFVSNAIKFTPEGAILISARRRGTDVLFQVWDTGIGIPEEHINRIFDEFYQINNPQRNRSGGLGLGLSIVERSLALLAAKIECRSVVGHGSVFGFRLALDHTSIDDRQHTQVAFQDEVVSGFFASGKRFVVVEDDALVAEALSKTLVMMGGEVKCFHNAEDAMRYANIGHATYYIVDYMLGGKLNGLQFLSQLGKSLGRPINAVLMTGDTSSISAREFAACGWPVLHKPANISQLLSSLRAQAL